jgi:outer membrane immunogenic protein
MRKLFLAGAATVVLSTSAFAADLGLPTKAPPMMPPPAPVYNWNGFYIGGHLGWDWAEHHVDSFNYNTGAFADHIDFNSNGFFGGGQIGYNYVFAPNWLIGFEFDGSVASISTDVLGCSATGCSTSHNVTDDFGTGRGRLGYIVGSALFYGTGGWAWSESHSDRTIVCTGPACPGTSTVSPLVGQTSSASGFQNGWSAGGGIEWGFAPGWSAKVEYLHLQFDNVTRDFFYNPATADRHNISNNSSDSVRIGVNFHFSPFGAGRM